MAAFASPAPSTHLMEHLTGAVERVTFHSEETGFCVLRVKVRGHRDLVTVVGTAATITPGEYIEGQGVWVNDRTHGLQFKTQALPAMIVALMKSSMVFCFTLASRLSPT
jgi:hypothetical protein